MVTWRWSILAGCLILAAASCHTITAVEPGGPGRIVFLEAAGGQYVGELDGLVDPACICRAGNDAAFVISLDGTLYKVSVSGRSILRSADLGVTPTSGPTVMTSPFESGVLLVLTSDARLLRIRTEDLVIVDVAQPGICPSCICSSADGAFFYVGDYMQNLVRRFETSTADPAGALELDEPPICLITNTNHPYEYVMGTSDGGSGGAVSVIFKLDWEYGYIGGWFPFDWYDSPKILEAVTTSSEHYLYTVEPGWAAEPGLLWRHEAVGLEPRDSIRLAGRPLCAAGLASRDSVYVCTFSEDSDSSLVYAVDGPTGASEVVHRIGGRAVDIVSGWVVHCVIVLVSE